MNKETREKRYLKTLKTLLLQCVSILVDIYIKTTTVTQKDILESVLKEIKAYQRTYAKW